MASFPVELPPAAARWRFLASARRHHNVLLFVAGFLFDVVTLKRIDSWTDLAIQLAYLTGLTVLLVFQHREKRGRWKPGPRVERLWRYNVEVLHFFYGGLLSNYVVLYFKSSAGLRPLVFFLFLVGLMFLNETPALRRVGSRLRTGLYAFCVASFMIYFVPVVIGRMGDGVFHVSQLLSGLIVWGIAGVLARDYAAGERFRNHLKLFLPAGIVLATLSFLYVGRLVPPVPLSVKFDGLYHDVVREDGGYRLRASKPPFYAFWRTDSRPFRARKGDRLFYFARVFAPSRFVHHVMIRWEYFDEAAGRYVTSDRIPMTVLGGRDQGFRGYAIKSNYQPGRWRVSVETEDGRVFGHSRFRVEEDGDRGERRWVDSVM